MKAVSSMATRHLLADLAEAACEAGLPRVRIFSSGGVEVARRVAEGELVDLVFLAADALSDLADRGHVDQTTIRNLVVSRVAVAVRAGEADVARPPRGPAFKDADAVRMALDAAHRIGYSTGPSGRALLAMIEDWGMTAAVEPKLQQARPGVPVAAMVAAGEVDLGFQQLSELVGQSGVRVAGVLPDDCAIDTIFAGAVARRTKDPEVARSILSYFCSPSAAAIVSAHNFRAT